MASSGNPPEDSSSDEEGQAFYVGGSDHSGQQVLGPKKKKNKNLVDRVLENVREHAEQVEVGPSGSQPTRSYFTGTGHRLGESADEPSAVQPNQRPPSPRTFALRMYENGFSIDDGPLRDYEEAESQRFLQSIERGQIPSELIQMANGGEVEVNMEDRRHETFRQPKSHVKAFAGEGHLLGSSISPTIVGGTAEVSEADRKANEEKAKRELKLNSGEPTTNLQLRLSDGSRIVAQFNHTHTIRDVRMFIVRARPQYEVHPFSLMTAYPSKELTDEVSTLKDLNLLNAVIIQRVTG